MKDERRGVPTLPTAYQGSRDFITLLIRLFFRRVEVTGIENLPEDRGGLLVAWHPNGMVDPGLILHASPRQIVFGARHGLFQVPLLKHLIEGIGAVPIYRKVDLEAASEKTRKKGNMGTLSALADAIQDGRFAALFPEGVSHDAPHLQELKTGAARLYYQARAADPEAPPPVLIPVGIHYEKKRIFRSNALVVFHPPMLLPAELDVTPDPAEPNESAFSRAKRLTQTIEEELEAIVHPTESWRLHYLFHRARTIVRAERAHRAGAQLRKPEVQEQVLGFARIWTGYHEGMKRNSDQVKALVERVEEYDEDIRALHLRDHELDHAPRWTSPWLPILLAVQFIAVFFLFPPILAIGYLVNIPTAALLKGIIALAAREEKDVASIKLLVGFLLFPIAWVGFGVLAWSVHGMLLDFFPGLPDTAVRTGLVMAALSGVGGAMAVRYLRVAKETFRAVRVRLTRKLRWFTLERLREERSDLHDQMIALSAEFELPGEVTADGRIVPEPPPTD